MKKLPVVIFILALAGSANFSAAIAGSELTYKAPSGWVKEEPKSRMRKAQYRWPGDGKAGDATMTVFFFPGMGGSVEANLQRWYGQFKTEKGSAVTKADEKSEKKVGDIAVTTVLVKGTYLEKKAPMMMKGPVTEKPNFALLGAIAETKDGPWFFKSVGSEATISKWRKSFDKFVSSFQIEKK